MAIDGRRDVAPRQQSRFWVETRVDQLRELWPQRTISTSAIAKLLGGGCTKNMVISKARRIDLGTRDPDYEPRKIKPVPCSMPSQHECAFPIGHPGQDGFHFCGDPAMPGRSYCPTHRALTSLKPTAKAQVEAAD